MHSLRALIMPWIDDFPGQGPALLDDDIEQGDRSVSLRHFYCARPMPILAPMR